MVRSSTGRRLKQGGVVRIVSVPAAVNRQSPRDTRRLFRALIGHRFKIRAIAANPVLLELDVTRVGVPLIGGTAHVIYIEPEHVA